MSMRFSDIYLRDGHEYEVRLNENTDNPRVVELIGELRDEEDSD
jgi:hypothetical protein